jgi:hypothetical protein
MIMAEVAERTGMRRAWAVLAVQLLLAVGEAFARPPALPATAPVPQPRPEDPIAGDKTSSEPPIPLPRPASPHTADDGNRPPAPGVTVEKPSIPRPTVSLDARRECLIELRKLQVDFVAEEPVSDPIGCAIPNPVTLKNLGGKVALAPDALLDCPMALASVRFMNDVAAVTARREVGSDLTSINQASAYVCRPRHGATKLSEHAFGNALDVASFGLADGRRIDVKAGAADAEAKFLDAVRKAACGPLKTVLGPGSDADHALHFHFDLAPRRRGSTFCQ